MDLLAAVRTLGGLIILCLLPGWAWGLVLLPNLRGLAKFVAAVGLSVVIVTLAAFLGSTTLEVQISAAHAVWWSLALTAAGLTTLAGQAPRASRPRA